jgi:chemotaxis protein MotB
MSEINDISDPLNDDLDNNKKEKKDKKEKKAKAHQEPVIKKIKKGGHGHHGGSWKIAYADFVTAMMAFFLLMWLVASLNKAQKAAIADYFKQPLKVALFGGKNLGDRQINVKDGGPTASEIKGQIQATDKPLKNQKKAADTGDSNNIEIKKLEALKAEINLSIQQDPALAGLKKQLLMDVVSDGLRIQLIDNKNKPMFEVGSDKINPQILPILTNIAKLLNSVPNKITIQGHTDAHPYYNPDELDYTNWELSTQRANAARRALVKAGLIENKVMMVTGFSSTVLLDKANPLNPENRRISIIVMKKIAEDKITTNK